MTKTTSGWVLLIVSLGMMCGLLASDVSKLADWNGVFQPSFVGIVMSHFGSVVLSFVGGKMIPETRDSTTLGRASDKKENVKDENVS